MASTDRRAGPADLLLLGGPVHTLEPPTGQPHQPPPDGVAVRGERIVAVGDRGTLAKWRGRGTRVVDLGGRAVVPGFVDAHVHFADFAMSRRRLDLDGVASLEAGLALLAEAAAGLPDGDWLLGRGWDRHRWGSLPTAADLDRVTGARPTVLSSRDGHSQWLNSAALAAAGVGSNTADPPGGRIERDAAGAPAGVLFESAQDLAWAAVPRPSVAEVAEAIRQALPLATAAGITGIHNFEDSLALRAFAALRRGGDLTLRVFHGLARESLAAAAQVGLETGFGDPWLRIGLVKVFADGALGSRTAWLLEPYERQANGYRGVPRLEPQELRQVLTTAVQAGLGVAVHAIGDAAVRATLDDMGWARSHLPAAERALLRIEHAQLVHPEDVPRFAALDVVASMQPAHAVSDWRAADANWGRRAAHGYAWRSLLDAGARLAFGTDAPIERIEPLASLRAAVTRTDPDGNPPGAWYPEQRLSLREALAAYTLGSAGAEGAAHERGSIAPGKLADLVVLSADPFARNGEALAAARVDLTIVGGRVVHER